MPGDVEGGVEHEASDTHRAASRMRGDTNE